MIEKIENDPHHILDRDEIAALLSRLETAARFEQLHPPLAAILIEEVKGDRGHASFVRLPGAIYVEVAQPDDLRGIVAPTPAHDAVEQPLRITIDVERALVARVFAKYFARTVDRRRRSVDERHLFGLTEIEQLVGVPVVVLHHVTPVALHRVRAGALMPDPAHLTVEGTQAQLAQK